jgi:hypothetical protein
MTKYRILGLVAFAIGLLLMKFGYDATQAPVEELSNKLTGNYTDHTMWYFAGGVVAMVGGILVGVFGVRK